MICVDPSELRSSSILLKYISDVVYSPLPHLEESTGADLMISADNLPPVKNARLLQMHIEKGAKLIQIKFGHDLPSSIVDGRLNEALLRMQSTGAQPWQCLLLFVSVFDCDDTGMAIIDNEPTYTDRPMSYKQVKSALEFWTERGGSHIFPLSRGELIPIELEIHQDHLNRFSAGETEKTIWAAQKIVGITDLRNMLRFIPEVRIGEKKVNAIWSYMEENNIRQDFGGFLEMLKSDELLKVPGIGKGLISAIHWGLWRTEEERLERIK